MQKDFIKYNFAEVINLRDKLKTKEQVLQKDLSNTKRQLRTVEEIIKRNDTTNQNWLVLLPSELFTTKNQLAEKKRINWKRIVIELFSKYNHPMTSDLLYAKARINYEEISSNRTFCLTNLSAALHYLTFSDGKLNRVKENKRKTFIYGFHHFFEMSGQLKKEYYEKFKMEYEGKI